jgi:polyhydroxyalkanoate synthesis regulator phasin
MPAANDLFRRLLDSGVTFTQMTQQRAEAIVRDLVRAGEVQSEQTSQLVQDIVDRSRQNTEKLLETIRKEIREQVSALGLARRDELQAVREAVNRLTGRGTRKAPGAKTAAAKKASGARKTAAKKTTRAKKTAKKAVPAKRSTAKKAPTKSTGSPS